MLLELRKARKITPLTLATFPRVWIRPSKHGNHKVIVYFFMFPFGREHYSDNSYTTCSWQLRPYGNLCDLLPKHARKRNLIRATPLNKLYWQCLLYVTQNQVVTMGHSISHDHVNFYLVILITWLCDFGHRFGYSNLRYLELFFVWIF